MRVFWVRYDTEINLISVKLPKSTFHYRNQLVKTNLVKLLLLFLHYLMKISEIDFQLKNLLKIFYFNDVINKNVIIELLPFVLNNPLCV
jgi:hypothetical protein